MKICHTQFLNTAVGGKGTNYEDLMKKKSIHDGVLTNA
jgi:hypothetical protein